MKTSVTVKTIFNCSLERAFKTPILSDVTKVHTGYGFTPRVTHCTEDEGWGQPGSRKRVFVAKSWTQNGGEASIDRVLERRENEYWKIEVSDFKMPMLGFTAFTGEWSTKELEKNKIEITYTYTLHSKYLLLYPLNWLFTKLFWRRYMKQVLENIRKMTVNREPYLYP